MSVLNLNLHDQLDFTRMYEETLIFFFMYDYCELISRHSQNIHILETGPFSTKIHNYSYNITSRKHYLNAYSTAVTEKSSLNPVRVYT